MSRKIATVARQRGCSSGKIWRQTKLPAANKAAARQKEPCLRKQFDCHRMPGIARTGTPLSGDGPGVDSLDLRSYKNVSMTFQRGLAWWGAEPDLSRVRKTCQKERCSAQASPKKGMCRSSGRREPPQKPLSFTARHCNLQVSQISLCSPPLLPPCTGTTQVRLARGKVRAARPFVLSLPQGEEEKEEEGSLQQQAGRCPLPSPPWAVG